MKKVFNVEIGYEANVFEGWLWDNLPKPEPKFVPTDDENELWASLSIPNRWKHPPNERTKIIIAGILLVHRKDNEGVYHSVPWVRTEGLHHGAPLDKGIKLTNLIGEQIIVELLPEDKKCRIICKCKDFWIDYAYKLEALIREELGEIKTKRTTSTQGKPKNRTLTLIKKLRDHREHLIKERWKQPKFYPTCADIGIKPATVKRWDPELVSKWDDYDYF